jgi:hypothetical protein
MRIFLFILLFFILPIRVEAIYDPLSVPNNKYGMHIVDFNDIADVAPLVNSTGGDWGYITVVVTDSDRDPGRWQSMFDRMRRLHLIPLVRIATHVEKDYWVKPNPGNLDELVTLFNSLNWPTQNRYIIVYNEPNHAKEWGGHIDPEGYANTLVELGKKFKAASEDFFILPAGLDVSAASDSLSLDAAVYLERMIKARPEVLEVIDGWNSHSYPNPAFSGSPFATGRGTLSSYVWEINYLKSLGLKKELPIFITETGWVHAEGKVFTRGLLSSDQVGSNLQIAAAGAWKDPRIAAITPFVFNYQDVPFDTFSWKRMSGEGGFYPQYNHYLAIPKTQGHPIQKESYTLSDTLLPPAVVSGATYTLRTQITNIGQGILSSDGYEVELQADRAGFTFLSDALPTLEPNEKGELVVHIKAPSEIRTFDVAIAIKRHGRITLLETQRVEVVPPPSVVLNAKLGWRRIADANDVTVLVYDDNDNVLHKFTSLTLKDGQVEVKGLSQILPGHPYRIVLLVPYYLPRQIIAPLNATETELTLKRLLPLDFNRDGKFALEDLWSLLKKPPHDMIGLFITP